MSAEVADLAEGISRLQQRVNDDLFELETMNKSINALLANAPIGVITVDNAGRCIFINPAARRFFNEDENVISQKLAQWVAKDESGRQGSHITLAAPSPEAKPQDFMVSRVARSDSAGRPDGSWVIVTNISELVQSQRQVRQLAEGYDSLLRSLPLGVLALDDDSVVQFSNSAAEGLAVFKSGGLGQLVTKAFAMLEDGDEVAEWEWQVPGLPTQSYLLVVNSRVNDQGVTSGLWLIVMDLSEQRTARTQLIQAAKLASLGEMSTGMAHELNQPLNVIALTSGNLRHSLKKMVDPEDPVFKKLEKIDAALNRASTIIDHMRSHGRIASDQLSCVDLSTVVASVVEMLGEQMKQKNILLLSEVPESGLYVMGNSIQLEQVLINLANNARDAILDNNAGAGQIGIEGEASSGLVTLRVTDTGGGIPEDALQHIFEPFYTTKPVGKGTGLGGSISYGIVKDLQGDIWAENVSGGACITLQFPAANVAES